MQIAVITVQREPMYLYETLAQLRASTDAAVDVFIGSPEDRDILAALAAFPDVHGNRIYRIPEDIWALIEPLPAKLRAVGNFMAALQSGDGDLVLFEDDIAIKPGWLDVAQALRRWTPDTFVSLYSHQDLRRGYPRIRIGRVRKCMGMSQASGALLPHPLRDFYGTLGLVVPGQHRKPLAEAALRELDPCNPWPPEMRWPFDHVVQGYINDHRECSMVCSIPSYVDHRGDVSVINPTHGPRRAPMF